MFPENEYNESVGYYGSDIAVLITHKSIMFDKNHVIPACLFWLEERLHLTPWIDIGEVMRISKYHQFKKKQKKSTYYVYDF